MSRAPIDIARRRLLALAGGMTASGLVPGLSALALRGAAAQSFTDYKALVCVFLYGGNDTNNTVVPLDDYAQYAAVRGGSSVGAVGTASSRRSARQSRTPLRAASRSSRASHRSSRRRAWPSCATWARSPRR